MPVVRSARFGNGSATVNGEQIVVTVPAGHRYLVKRFSVYNNTNAAHQVTLGVQVGGVDYWIGDTTSIGSGLIQKFEGECVMDAGDKLVFYTGSTMASIWYASGVDFTL